MSSGPFQSQPFCLILCDGMFDTEVLFQPNIHQDCLAYDKCKVMENKHFVSVSALFEWKARFY